jgi:protein O-GlcNAc transferase
LNYNPFKKIHMARRLHIPNRAQQPKKQIVQLDQTIVQIFQRGLASHQRGQLSQAKSAYEQVLEKQPRHFDALHLLGVIACQTKAPALAEQLIRKAIEVKPNDASAHYNLGVALKDLKLLDDAVACYDQAIVLKSDYAEAFNNRGIALKELKRLDDAIESYDAAITLKPDYFQAFNNRGNALRELGRLDDALASYDKAVALKQNDPSVYFNRGIVLQELKRLNDALASYEKAINLKPDYSEVFNNRGNAFKELERLDDALASYDKAISLNPEYASGYYNRGTVLQQCNRLNDALACYDQAIALKPDYTEALNNRGTTLKELNRLDDAIASYDKAIAFKPDYFQAFNNRGIALQELKLLQDALASYNQAIALKPDYAEALNNRGIVLQQLKRWDDAMASYEKAINLKPDYVQAFHNQGNALRELERLDDALASYDKAISLNPEYEFLQGTKLHTQMRICDWSDLQNKCNRISTAIADQLKVIPPFFLLGLMDGPDLQLKASKIFANAKYPERLVESEFTNRQADEKIRIGYYSADFRDHPVSHLMAELFELHDTERFEIYGFSFRNSSNSEMRQRVENAIENFIDVSTKSDTEIVMMSRNLGIDIAVDLGGFTQDSRTGIFAQRCAPIQINYLGYPGTLGAPYFDYIFADRTVIPHESEQYYSEKVVYLPYSFQVNDSQRKISDRIFSRHELGLPEDGFVFCCFNNNYKILPETFDSWMRVLKATGGSVLWLLEDNPTAAQNLRKEAQIRGVDPERLVFAARMKLDEHLARHRAADLFLDTLPFNAGATGSAALWSGLPLLTQIGESFVARYGASLLNAMDLPELITNTREEYEAGAIELANNPLRLSEIKKKLEQNRETSPLFNGKLFARHIESAYAEIHRRHLCKEKPDHIYVESLVN